MDIFITFQTFCLNDLRKRIYPSNLTYLVYNRQQYPFNCMDTNKSLRMVKIHLLNFHIKMNFTVNNKNVFTLECYTSIRDYQSI